MMRDPRVVASWAVLSLTLAACARDNPAGGTSCGQQTCRIGQVCCIDCDGNGSCLDPGSACPGTSCNASTQTRACGDRDCAAGQVCCIDCDGRGSCGNPGLVCAGTACNTPIANGCKTAGCSGEACVAADQEGLETACVDKPEYACYRRHGECGPFGADGQCAWKQTPELTACLQDPCPGDCGPYCFGLAPARCPNPGCRCPEPRPDCPDDCSSWCTGERPDCPDPGCECQTPCGAESQLCCADQSCDQDLSCCMGVPYHDTWGTCETECNMLSDRALKTDVRPADRNALLDALVALPINFWRYRTEDGSVRHLGPMAQDFRAAFGLGTSDRRIHAVDANGVTLAAIQALHGRMEQLEAKNQRLSRQLRRLRIALDARSAR